VNLQQEEKKRGFWVLGINFYPTNPKNGIGLGLGLNWKIRKRQAKSPRKPVKGNPPRFNGTSKDLFNSVLLYLMMPMRY
jgi:hypothetical protein